MEIGECEREKLRVLLPHWIEHNMEHAQEFRRWAAQAGASGIHIKAAASLIEDANQELEDALKLIGGSPTAEP